MSTERAPFIGGTGPGMTDSGPDALLFDLGGVIIDLDFGRVFERWAVLSGQSADVLRSRFRFDDSYEHYERGEIDSATYFAALRSTLDLDLTLDELIDGWNAVFLGPFPGATDLLASLASRFPLFALTNSNPTHQACWSQLCGQDLSVFQAVFVSSTIGTRKPERDSYLFVADHLGVSPERFHFFDDSPDNVTGARRAGMSATHVTSFEDLLAKTANMV